MNVKTTHKGFEMRIVIGLCLALAAGVASAGSAGEGLWESRPVALDPAAVVGPQACAECHEQELGVWDVSEHQASSQVLTRNPRTRSIAKALGVRRVKTDPRCASCHFTLQKDDAGRDDAVAGVSCESCHGAAQGWLKLHDDFGGSDVTRATESKEHRSERLGACVAAGMNHPDQLTGIARTCFACHTIGDGQLLAAGHPDGSDFELVAWSQGEVRHNFVRGNGENVEAGLERRRVMYVVGRLLELSHGIQLVDASTEAGAQRLADLLSSLRDAAPLMAVQHVRRAVALFDGVRWAELTAEERDRLGQRVDDEAVGFEREHDGSELAALDGWLPDADAYVRSATH